MTTERPTANLRALRGRELAYASCNTVLVVLRRWLLAAEYADVEGVVIRAMIRSGIAEVAT